LQAVSYQASPRLRQRDGWSCVPALWPEKDALIFDLQSGRRDPVEEAGFPQIKMYMTVSRFMTFAIVDSIIIRVVKQLLYPGSLVVAVYLAIIICHEPQ
jgi:hypothetical protein